MKKAMPRALKSEELTVMREVDIVTARQKVRGHAIEMGWGPVDQTKIETAASELARNMVQHAGGGTVSIEEIEDAGKRGIRIIFEDQGPGIPDMDLAMQDGYTTRNGMGLGLPGAKRLVNDFEITSRQGKGTRVIITKWET
jgi:serine/threonine-protein kinase RsbT